LSHLSDAERRAYVLADNKLAQNASWDREILALELQGPLDLDFEVDLTRIGLAEFHEPLGRAGSSRARPSLRKVPVATSLPLPLLLVIGNTEHEGGPDQAGTASHKVSPDWDFREGAKFPARDQIPCKIA
jgi:hypothetical protein